MKSWTVRLHRTRSPSPLAALAATLAALATAPAGAAEGAAPIPRSQARAERAAEPARSGEGFAIYGGLGLGYMALDADYASAGINGLQVNLLGIASYRLTDWFLDGGLGWLHSDISGKLSSTQRIEYKTRAAFVELSPRYRLSEPFSLGPVADYAFGTDLSFKRGVGPSNSALFLGLQGVYDLEGSRSTPIRLFGRVLRDLDIQDETVTQVMLGIQIGFPISGQYGAREEAPQTAVLGLAQEQGSGAYRFGAAETMENLGLAGADGEPAPAAVAGAAPEFRPPANADQIISQQSSVFPMPVDSAQPADQVRVALNPELIHFETNSDRLDARSRAFLERLGRHLQANGAKWTAVEISGHADERGSFKYNMTLSQRRARSVARSLRAGGVSPERLKISAHSYTMPLDPAHQESAWAKNRRVEMMFKGVDDPASFQKLLVRFGTGQAKAGRVSQ